MLSHVSTLVVASQQQASGWEVDLDGEQQLEYFNPKDTPINVVPKKQVVDLTWISSLLQHMDKIIVLAMDVANNNNGLWHLRERGLLL